MKKTLLTIAFVSLGALAPVASAATTLLELKVENGVLNAYNSSGTLVEDVVTLNGATVNDDSFTSASNNRIQVNTSSFGIKMNDGWTVTFNATMSTIATSWPVLCGMGEDNSYNYKAGYYDNAFEINPEGYGMNDQTVKAGVVDTAEHSYSFIFYGNTENLVELYQDGKLVASRTATSEYGANTVGVLTLGGRPYNNGNLTPGTTFSDVKVYQGVVVPVPVPEPATASLSLLGLAALMMRRRRA